MNAPVKPNRLSLVFWQEIAAVVLLLTLVCVISWPGMKAPLLLDDLGQIAFDHGLGSWKNCWGTDSFHLFRPVKNLIFHGVNGLPLFQWHAVNLSLYLVAILAVYLILRRIMGSATWALLAAALWATCPTQATTAVWMSCANISVAVTLACACLFLHDLTREKSGKNIFLVTLMAISLFAAECSYETAVSVPALCILVDLLKRRRTFSREAIVRYAILAAVTLVYLIIRSRMGAVQKAANYGFSPDIQKWQLSLSAPWFLWKHFTMWLMPLGRIEFGSTYIWGISASPWELAAAWVWLFILIGITLFSWKRIPWLSFGLLWFFITSFPPSNFIPVWAGPIEDYYLIFPGIGLSIALLGCVKAVKSLVPQACSDHRMRSVNYVILSVIALWRFACIPLFWFQTSLWCRPLELYLRCEMTRPAQFVVQALAARELYLQDHRSQAKVLAQKSYDTAPWFPSSSIVLGFIALDSSDLEGAENNFRQALRAAPEKSLNNDVIRIRLAQIFISQESRRHQIREILLPVLNNPQSQYHLDAINLQIDCYLRENLPENARRAAGTAVKLHPGNAQLAGVLADIERKYPASESPK